MWAPLPRRAGEVHKAHSRSPRADRCCVHEQETTVAVGPVWTAGHRRGEAAREAGERRSGLWPARDGPFVAGCLTGCRAPPGYSTAPRRIVALLLPEEPAARNPRPWATQGRL
jgi:hypothetical protein